MCAWYTKSCTWNGFAHCYTVWLNLAYITTCVLCAFIYMCAMYFLSPSTNCSPSPRYSVSLWERSHYSVLSSYLQYWQLCLLCGHQVLGEWMNEWLRADLYLWFFLTHWRPSLHNCGLFPQWFLPSTEWCALSLLPHPVSLETTVMVYYFILEKGIFGICRINKLA